MSESMVIQSHKGEYHVQFGDGLLDDVSRLLQGNPHVLVDRNVARLHARAFAPLLALPTTIEIDATEESKSLQNIIPVIERLVADRTRRDHTLVAVGGGIIQDITCFIASTLLRGVEWKFVPTTLLAQADSCIGSKSSINLGAAKNILGTFNPPREIFVCPALLDTLQPRDIRSGIGEILKVHAIDGRESFDRAAADYPAMLEDRATLLRYVRAALEVKKRYIESDEFDRGIRNVFNYGHSFGHAIESATDFAVPHGIAVTMGMDIANRISSLRGMVDEAHYRRMHGVLRRNYEALARTPIGVDAMLSALIKDKKNLGAKLVLIFPVGEDARIERVQVDADVGFRAQLTQALAEIAR